MRPAALLEVWLAVFLGFWTAQAAADMVEAVMVSAATSWQFTDPLLYGGSNTLLKLLVFAAVFRIRTKLVASMALDGPGVTWGEALAVVGVAGCAVYELWLGVQGALQMLSFALLEVFGDSPPTSGFGQTLRTPWLWIAFSLQISMGILLWVGAGRRWGPLLRCFGVRRVARRVMA